MPVPAVKRALGLAMNKVWGSLQIDSGLNPEHVSHDPAVVRAYIDDPLNHSKVTPRFFESFVQEMDTVKNGAAKIRADLPLCLFIPGDDRICSRTEMLAFASTRPLETHVYEYPGFFHEIFNETGKERAFEDWQKNL
jgi:alpha-beta hydrolase superfamily lysophospholipase